MAVVWRQKNKILLLAALVGGGYVGVKVIKRKLQELQDKEASVHLETIRFQEHFLGNCNTAMCAVKDLLPSLRAAIMRLLDAEAITQQLSNKPPNKLELWNQLKVISFTRLVGGVYAYALLLVFVRVQLSILGGIILHSLKKKGQGQSAGDNKVHKEYLAIVQHLLKEGLHGLLESVRVASEQVLAHYSLKQVLSSGGVVQLLQDIRQQAALPTHTPPSPHSSHPSLVHWRQQHFLLRHSMPKETLLQQPPGGGAEVVGCVGGGMLEELLMGTRDLVESEEMVEVVETCVEIAFTHTTRQLLVSLTSASCQQSSADLAMARVIPVVCDNSLCIFQTHTQVSTPELLSSKQVQTLSRNIYEAFSANS